MEKCFKLYFSEEKQKFHLDDSSFFEKSGYILIFEEITTIEFIAYMYFIKRVNPIKYSKKYIRITSEGFRIFLKNLKNENIKLVKNKK